MADRRSLRPPLASGAPRGARAAAVLLLAAVVGGAPREARGELPALLRIDGGASSCPSAQLVARAVRKALPPLLVVVGDEAAGRSAPAGEVVTASLVDRGDRFEVTVAGQQRVVRDRGRRCEERARSAAVFIVLRLAPPSVGLLPPPVGPSTEPPPTPSEPPEPEELEPPAPPPPTGRWEGELPVMAGRAGLGVELFGLFTDAPAQGMPSGGGGLRLLVGRQPVVIALGASATAPAEFSLGPLSSFGTDVRPQATLLRVPLDLSLRLSLRRPGFTLAGELGPGLDLLYFRQAQLGGRLYAQGALRAAVRLGWRAGSFLEPFLSLDVVVEPVPRPVTIAGTSEVFTHAPSAWLGVALGLAAQIF